MSSTSIINYELWKKYLLFVLLAAFSMVVTAKESVLNTDTICCDTIGCNNLPIPQIPFGELDSLTMHSIDARYVVVWKGGKCGIYDLQTEENVTRIEYSYLHYSFRKEMDGEYYTFFVWEEKETTGVVGIAEANNQFMAIAKTKKNETDEIP